MSAERTFARLGHAVKRFASELCAEVECCRAGRECDGVLAADLLGGEPFDLVDVRADGAHPVGFVSLGDVLDLVAVHCRAREPDLLLETRHGLPQPQGYSDHLLFIATSAIPGQTGRGTNCSKI